MERFIPYEKLSKRERQKRNAARRGSWNGLDPVTRRPENTKAYNRRRARKWSDDSMTVPFATRIGSEPPQFMRRRPMRVFFAYCSASLYSPGAQ